MEEDILNYSPTVMFRETPCTICTSDRSVANCCYTTDISVYHGVIEIRRKGFVIFVIYSDTHKTVEYEDTALNNIFVYLILF